MHCTEKYHFYEQEICNHICQNGVLQEHQIVLGRLWHSIIVAILMLVYHVILCKFILYLKR